MGIADYNELLLPCEILLHQGPKDESTVMCVWCATKKLLITEITCMYHLSILYMFKQGQHFTQIYIHVAHVKLLASCRQS